MAGKLPQAAKAVLPAQSSFTMHAATPYSMHRFFLPPEQCQGTSLCLTGEEAHHARHVVRVRLGERVAVVDGAGHELLCELEGYNHDQARFTVVEKCFHPAPPSPVTLLQAVPKGKLMEAIIQKATELGAFRIVPLLSERVVARLDVREGVRKAEKWRLVAREAIKQCGSAWLPTVDLPMTPNQFLARAEGFDLALIASLESGSRPARECFRSFEVERRQRPRSVCVWVGPEGDFTPAEMEAIKSHGALPITLGRLVLRTETAAIYCLSIINHELQSPADQDDPVS
jgi:16S rRNA (uracil1498-N3)-methyltransferase